MTWPGAPATEDGSKGVFVAGNATQPLPKGLVKGGVGTDSFSSVPSDEIESPSRYDEKVARKAALMERKDPLEKSESVANPGDTSFPWKRGDTSLLRSDSDVLVDDTLVDGDGAHTQPPPENTAPEEPDEPKVPEESKESEVGASHPEDTARVPVAGAEGPNDVGPDDSSVADSSKPSASTKYDKWYHQNLNCIKSTQYI